MGSPKAWLDFEGEPLLVRVVRRMAEVASPVVVVAAPGQVIPGLPEGIIVVRDPVSGRGPLQGIAAGLDALVGRAEAAFVSSTDAPFIHPALVRRLHALRQGSFDIAVPRAKGRSHPLSAIYGLEARAEVSALLAADRLRLSSLFERLRTVFADEALLLEGDELRTADPELLSLENVNTPEEYAAALARVGR
jgi:molybdopterin-guanine dinucleotide biosynthesis protein A